jgi:glycosyltransferase involved in cell wall biosynthesis
MEQVKVSVIVPNYNHATFLDERMKSILSQTFQDFEIIILDDNSTDGSKTVIEQYKSNSKVKATVYNTTNSGSPFIQWNKGIRLASGKYVWIAESDDTCDDNFLMTLVQQLEKDDEVVLAYCKSIRVDEHGRQLDDLNWWYNDINKSKWLNDYVSSGDEEINTALVKKNTIPNASAVVFRREAALQIGLAPTNYRLSGDWLFWILLLTRGKVAYSVSGSNYFRTHTRSVRSEESLNLTSIKEKLKITSFLASRKIIADQSKTAMVQSIQLELANAYRSQSQKIQKRSVHIARLLMKCLMLRSGMSFNI